ncbi:MAG: hypothetical protein JJU02_10400 [Cryomorphaceae bacterium]|nr:hypothetical protein [Cryomorphaceae bacterium]
MISIKIKRIFEPEQVRIQKSNDQEDFGRKGLFRADSTIKHKKPLQFEAVFFLR